MAVFLRKITAGSEGLWAAYSVSPVRRMKQILSIHLMAYATFDKKGFF